MGLAVVCGDGSRRRAKRGRSMAFGEAWARVGRGLRWVFGGWLDTPLLALNVPA